MKHRAGNTMKWYEWAVYTFKKVDKHARRHALQAFQPRQFGVDGNRIFADQPDVRKIGTRVLIMQACERM